MCKESEREREESHTHVTKVCTYTRWLLVCWYAWMFLYVAVDLRFENTVTCIYSLSGALGANIFDDGNFITFFRDVVRWEKPDIAIGIHSFAPTLIVLLLELCNGVADGK